MYVIYHLQVIYLNPNLQLSHIFYSLEAYNLWYSIKFSL